jgi:hypothetical protein
MSMNQICTLVTNAAVEGLVAGVSTPLFNCVQNTLTIPAGYKHMKDRIPLALTRMQIFWAVFTSFKYALALPSWASYHASIYPHNSTLNSYKLVQRLYLDQSYLHKFYDQGFKLMDCWLSKVQRQVYKHIQI